MSQNIQLSARVQITNGSQVTVMQLVDSLNPTTGSNSIVNNANIATGSWQVLDQGSNTNFRYGAFVNTDATSSCKIAVTTAGTASYAAWLQPGDTCILPSSGSTVLYAEAIGANSPIVLQYFLTEQ